MLTNNFYLGLAAQIVGLDRNYEKMISRSGDKNPFSSSDSIRPFNPVNGIIQANGTSGNYGGMGGLIIGTGDTPPTVNDYDLENQITTGFTSTTRMPTNNSNDKNSIQDSMMYVCSITITNTGVDDLVIKELGYIRGNSGGKAVQALFDRIVFDTPVSIAANETKTLEYHLCMPRP